MKYLAPLLLLLSPSLAFGAIAFDAATNGGVLGSSPKTWSHTVTGSNVALVVCTAHSTATTTDPVTSVTYNGTALTKYTFVPADVALNYYATDLWVLLNAPTGSHTVSISFSSGSMTGVSSSYSGVLGSVEATSSNTTAGATTLTTTLTTLTANDWTVMCGSDGGTSPTAGAGTTYRDTGGTSLFDSNAAIASPGSTSLTMNWINNKPAAATMIALSPTGAATQPPAISRAFWW